MTTSIRKLVTTLAVLATLGTAFMVTPVQAKSNKCTAVLIGPAHWLVTCTNTRP